MIVREVDGENWTKSTEEGGNYITFYYDTILSNIFYKIQENQMFYNKPILKIMLSAGGYGCYLYENTQTVTRLMGVGKVYGQNSAKSNKKITRNSNFVFVSSHTF